MATTLTAREKVERLVPWRRVTPAVPVDATGHTEEAACLNCATPLAGKFCHQCGQHAHVHRTLAAFGHDLLHGVLHLEGKAWRTLPKLLLRPGELTRRYIAGERVRFVSPLAMFLFSVFLMFAVMGLLGSPASLLDTNESGEVSSGLRKRVAELDAELVTLRREREAAVAKGQGTATLDAKIRDREEERGVVGGLVDMGHEGNSGDTRASRSAKLDVDVPSDATDGDQTREVTVGRSTVLGFQPGSAFDIAYRTAKQNPKLLLYKLQTNAYKFSWLLILISVPFVALLFLWRWRPLYDHTVFVTYSITAVSIVLIAAALSFLAGVPLGWIAAVACLFIPWHMYRQLREGYQLRRFSALWRTVMLAIFASFALGLFAFGLLMMGVLN